MFKRIKDANPDQFQKQVVPEMDYLEAILAEAVKSLEKAQHRDEAHIAEIQAMQKAIHDLAHPGWLTRTSTIEANLRTVNSLPKFPVFNFQPNCERTLNSAGQPFSGLAGVRFCFVRFVLRDYRPGL